MRCLCAYVIAIEAIGERMADAADLVRTLGAVEGIAQASLHSAIYWKDRRAIADFLTRNPRHTFKESFLASCLAGQVAVTLSHIGVWQRLLASEHDGALVFEDDIYITHGRRFQEIVAQLRRDDASEWVRLHLHKRFRDEVLALAGAGTFADDIQPWGFAGYYVSREGAAKMLGLCFDMGAPIDWLPPNLRRKGLLRCTTVTEVIVDHHAFAGDPAALAGRHETEKEADTVQKTASTIARSPRLAEDAALHGFVARLTNLQELRRDGVTVLKGLFGRDIIDRARRSVLANRHLLRNTRPTASAGHLAGFHRFPALEPLHGVLTGNRVIRNFIDLAVGGDIVRSIGLSDITVNRSQNWHVDLLRGKYRHHLDGALGWDDAGGGVYKLFLYLNDTNSLKVVSGSHRVPITLEDDSFAVPADDRAVAAVPVRAGDVVIMDIRCRHRGAAEADYAAGQWDDDPRILVSTVLGGASRKLTRAMEIGNFARLQDWSATRQTAIGHSTDGERGIVRTGWVEDACRRCDAEGAKAWPRERAIEDPKK